MSTLLQALSDGSFDMQNKRDTSSNFAKNLTSHRDTVVNDYIKHKIDLNKSIANLAKSKSLNDDQIKRIIEEVNNQVYLIEYSKMKEAPERHVTFDIAMLPKIKKIMDGSHAEDKKDDNSMQKKASECGSFEKIASEECIGDSLNFLSSNPNYGCTLKLESAESEQKIHLQKIASSIVEEDERLSKLASHLDNSLSTMASALTKYAELGADTRAIFKQLCKTANLDVSTQELIKSATEMRVDFLKETTPMPQEFSVDIKVEKVAHEKDFSLGKFSMQKVASQSNQTMPRIIANKVSIGNMNDLANIAQSILKQASEYADGNAKLEIAIEKVANLNLGNNAIDKMAKGFFNQILDVANTEKVASLDHSQALRNASKTLDDILAKSKAKSDKVKSIGSIPEYKEETKKSDSQNSRWGKATRKRNVAGKAMTETGKAGQFNSFNLQ